MQLLEEMRRRKEETEHLQGELQAKDKDLIELNTFIQNQMAELGEIQAKYDAALARIKELEEELGKVVCVCV